MTVPRSAIYRRGRHGCGKGEQTLPQTEKGENGFHFGTEAEKIPRMKGVETVKGQMRIKEAPSEFCSFSGDCTAADELESKKQSRNLKWSKF